MYVPGISIGDIPVGVTDYECGQAQVWKNRKNQFIDKVHLNLLQKLLIASVEIDSSDETDGLNIDYVTLTAVCSSVGSIISSISGSRSPE